MAKWCLRQPIVNTIAKARMRTAYSLTRSWELHGLNANGSLPWFPEAEIQKLNRGAVGAEEIECDQQMASKLAVSAPASLTPL